MSCLRLPRISDTVVTPAPLRISVRSAPSTMALGAASAARAAISAWATRAFSHWMRKLAIDGRKIRTSPSMTKITVIVSTLADRPRAGLLCGGGCGSLTGFGMPPSLAENLEDSDQFAQPWFRGQALIIGDGRAFSRLAQGRIWQDDTGHG